MALHSYLDEPTPSQILEIVSCEGISTTRYVALIMPDLSSFFLCRQTIRDTIKRYEKTGSVMDMPQPGRPKLLNHDHFVAIDNLMDENNELTTNKLKDKLLEQFPDLVVSERTIARGREELEW